MLKEEIKTNKTTRKTAESTGYTATTKNQLFVKKIKTQHCQCLITCRRDQVSVGHFVSFLVVDSSKCSSSMYFLNIKMFCLIYLLSHPNPSPELGLPHYPDLVGNGREAKASCQTADFEDEDDVNPQSWQMNIFTSWWWWYILATSSSPPPPPPLWVTPAAFHYHHTVGICRLIVNPTYLSPPRFQSASSSNWINWRQQYLSLQTSVILWHFCL